MQFCNGIIEAIGNTPLIKLERVSAATGCTILGKAEFMNPGQSVKDRAALFIIQDAVKRGELKPGGVIVEGTAGNTGIGLALVGNALGFRTVIVIPDTQSQEKKDTLRLCGAELVEVPAVPYSNPEQLREGLRPARRAIGEDRTERRDLGQPVRQRRQPPRPRRDDRAGNLAADRRQGRRLRLRGRHRRHARRRRHGAQRAQQRGAHRARRSDGRGALQLLHDRRRSSPKAPRSPKASARAASPRISKARRSTSPTRFPTRRRCRSSSICSSTKASASAARPASTSPAPFAWRRSSAPATPSSPFWPTTARAISRSCSIRSFCVRRICRCRPGSNAARGSRCPMCEH